MGYHHLVSEVLPVALEAVHEHLTSMAIRYLDLAQKAAERAESELDERGNTREHYGKLIHLNLVAR